MNKTINIKVYTTDQFLVFLFINDGGGVQFKPQLSVPIYI